MWALMKFTPRIVYTRISIARIIESCYTWFVFLFFFNFFLLKAATKKGKFRQDNDHALNCQQSD